MKVFNNLEEMEPYYVREINTYVFDFSVEFTFDLNTLSNIFARNIKAKNITSLNLNTSDIIARNIVAHNINVWNIKANDIKAFDINAFDISYHAVCYAYKNIECNSIKGRRKNAKHFVLDGEITIKPKTYKIIIDNKEIELSEESYNNFKKQFKE